MKIGNVENALHSRDDDEINDFKAKNEELGFVFKEVAAASWATPLFVNSTASALIILKRTSSIQRYVDATHFICKIKQNPPPYLF